jgi:hypothetical protein
LRISEHGRTPAKQAWNEFSMKKLMIMGGFIGFLVGLVSSSVSLGVASPLVFFRACISAAIGGLLLRWWGRLWIRSIAHAHTERLAAEASSNSTAIPQLNQH